MVEPRGAVMPDEGVKAREIIARWIDAFPGLGTIIADAHTVYDARRGISRQHSSPSRNTGAR